MFLFMAFGGTQIANLPGARTTTQPDSIDTSNLMYISLAFGLSLIINVWIFFRVSGALFNPAISLALLIATVISPLRAVLFIVAQLLGGIVAAALIDGLMPGPLNVGTSLNGGINTTQGTFSPKSRADRRTVFGDVFDGAIGVGGLHAHSRKTQVDFPCTCRNRSRPFRL